MKEHIEFISAGAGSGKTYTLTKRLNELLKSGDVQPSGVIATTFTILAAGELKERVRSSLMEDGQIQLANRMGQATISTVNGVCGQLLQRFSFEAGLSPEQQVIQETEAIRLFGEALDQVVGHDTAKVRGLNRQAHRLGYETYGLPEWRQHVSDIAQAARSNGMTPEQLPGFAKESVNSLLAHFRKPVSRDLDAELIRAIDQANQSVDLDIDSTKKTQDALRELNSARRDLLNERLTWAGWVRLAKVSPGKKSADCFAPVTLIAEDYESHPRFHEDIALYIQTVFDLAAECLESFQDLKTRQGLIDFTDQELLLYRLLEHPEVKETLEAELQLLMVDEFQDTSPIQLALFVRLAKLADRVIWVGDIKQAIYGFRGSDPELMQAVLQAVIADGGETTVLGKSWRSRPALVHYCSELFAQSFKDAIPAEQVKLEPARKELSPEPAVIRWKVTGNIGNQLDEIASGIKALVEDGYQIVDKKSEVLRPARYGDFAILCRSNDRLAAMAEACVGQGIAVSYKRAGLLKTPECRLALACLRRMADPSDTLATAEIRSLAHSESVEAWLPDRLAYLEEGLPTAYWGEEGDTAIAEVQALASIRQALAYLTPSEALAEAISVANVRQVVNGWGPDRFRSRERLANLDCLQQLALDYQGHCDVNFLAATISGFLLWLQEVASQEEDWQSVSQDDNVLALHTNWGAKGLEWPIVIVYDQEASVRTRLWGLSALGREGTFDVDDALGGRRLRFWPYPFGKQSKGIPLKERIEASQAGVTAMATAVAEERRLQYVSYTRARDLLILPVKIDTPDMLETLQCDWVYPDGNQIALPSGYKVATRCFTPVVTENDVARPQYHPAWLVDVGHDFELLPRKLRPSSHAEQTNARIGSVVELGERIGLEAGHDMALVGSALHASLGQFLANGGEMVTADVENAFARLGVSGAIQPADVLTACSRLQDYCQKTYPNSQSYVEYPLSWINPDGQELSGIIDLLIETDSGWIIIDHKSSPLPRSDWESTALGYAVQLALYAAALAEVSDKPVLGTWIHFMVTGGLVEIKYAEEHR